MRGCKKIAANDMEGDGVRGRVGILSVEDEMVLSVQLSNFLHESSERTIGYHCLLALLLFRYFCISKREVYSIKLVYAVFL